MNLLHVLYNKYYIEGFVNKPGDLKSAKRAMGLLHNFARVKNMNPEILKLLNKYQEGAEIISMPEKKIKELTDVSRFLPVMEVVFKSNVKINTDILTQKINDSYKQLAIKEGVMTAEQDLDDSITLDATKELLTKIVKKPVIKQEAKEEPKNAIQEENKSLDNKENVINDDKNINNDNVIHPAEDIINTNVQNVVNNAPVNKAFEEYKQNLLKFAVYATKEEGPDDTFKDICNIKEGKRTFDNAFQKYMKFLSDKNDPIEIFEKMIPEYNDVKLEQVSVASVIAYFASIANNGIKDENLSSNIKALKDKDIPLKDLFKTVLGLMTPEQNEKLYSILGKGTAVLGMLTRMYEPLGDNYREKIINNLDRVPNYDKFEPTGDEFYTFYYGNNPNKFDEHPLEAKVKSIIAENKDDAEYITVLNEANEFVVKATSEGIQKYFEISETGASITHYNEAREASEYVNAKVPGLSNVSKSTFAISRVFPPQELVNFTNADQFAKITLEEESKGARPSENNINALKAIAKEIQDGKLFDFTGFQTEEGTKVYGLKALARAAQNITAAVNAENPNKDDIKARVNEYKETKKKIDSVIKKLDAINNTKMIPSNVSVSRTPFFSGEYRSNVVGVSRLNGLYVTMGLCNKYGVDINDYLEDPNKYQKIMIAGQILKSEPARILENALNDIDAFDRFYSSSTNFADIQGLISDKGSARPAEFYSSMADNKEFSKSLFLTAQLSDALFGSDAVFKAIYENKGKTLANLMMYRKEDINIYKVCPVKLTAIDPNTFRLMEEPTPLKDYIKKLSIEELSLKLSEANKFYNLRNEKGDYSTAIDEIKLAMSELEYPAETISFLNKCLTEGHILEASTINDVELKRENLDPNFLDFYNKYSSLACDALGFVGQEVDLAKELEIRTMKYPSELKHNFYAEKLIEHLKVHGINLNKLGYGMDTNGVDKFMYDYANNKVAADINIVLPAGLFDSLENEANATYELRFDVPEGLIHNEADRAKAEFIKTQFVGTKKDVIDYTNVTETIVATKTSIKHSKEPFEELVEKDATYANSIDIGEKIAVYLPFKDNVHREEVRNSLNTFNLSDMTKSGILQVIDKMEEYGMLDGLDAMGAEQGVKVYSFKKFNDAKMSLNDALENNNLDEAYRIAQTCQQIKNEFHDVMDICEKVFPQDGEHCADNISISRNESLPIDFSTRQQAMIQLNAVYQIINACHTANYDVRQAINNPGEFINHLINSEKNRVLNHFTKENKGATLVSLMNGDVITGYSLSRGIEAMTSLESDSKLYKESGKVLNFFDAFIAAGTNIDNCFKVKNGDGEYVPDMTALKNYILDANNQSIEHYMVNNLDMATGKLYENERTYADILRDDNRNLEDVLRDTIAMLVDATKAIASLRENDISFPMENMYTAASSAVLDVLRKYDLEMTETPLVAAAKNFIMNPLDTVVDYIKRTDPEAARKVYDRVSKEDVTANLEEYGLFVSHALDTASDFNERVSDLDVDQIQDIYNNVKGPDNEIINPNNLSEMLLMGRRLSECYEGRGFIRKLFPSARRERTLLNTIKTELNRANVDATLINDIINGNGQDYPHKIAFAEGKLRENLIIKKYSVAGVNEKLNSILTDNEDHNITAQQLDAAMKMCKDINAVMSFVNQDTNVELTNAFNSIRNRIVEMQIPIEVQNRIISGELSSEDAILEAAEVDNRIRQEINDIDQVLNEDKEPIEDINDLEEVVEIQNEI